MRPPPHDSPARILLAEDDGSLRRMVYEVLRAAGFDVVPAENGIEALGLFRERGPYDLLLLDDDMPGLTGRQILARLRAEGVATSALLHTGNLEIDHAEEARLGARLLRKPFSLKALVAAVRLAICDG
jgi:DNA-binding response OmpR family regulator